MPPHESPSSSPPATPSRRRVKSCARKCEQFCCTLATYFPLAFVYSLTTWAVWTDTGIGFRSTNLNAEPPWSEKFTSVLGVMLYLMLNACYTVASFTDPGSPLKSSMGNKRGGKYSILPTSEPTYDLRDVQTITVSSTGSARYCKKCHVPKPDRAHHCSTCKRCVLKMDHHCPWLATCLGLHNYKAFVLFLVYTSIFCWVCFINSALWIWSEIFASSQYIEEFAPVNVIMLAVISGIIGLVLTGFTGWHIYLSVRGQTTIECLEKTRYLSKVRHRVEQNRQEQQSVGHKRGISEGGLAETIQRAGEQILEFHANAVPGASRYEEGEEHSSPTPSFTNTTLSSSKGPGGRTLTPSQVSQYDDFPMHENASPAERALRRNYSTYEADRERERYEEFLEDKESQKMPNAFDLGWRKNLGHLFGPVPLFWFLPVCNTAGDGWRWEVSPKWQAASEDAARRKEERIAAARARGEAEHEPQLRVEDDYRYPMDDSYSQRAENGQIYGRSAMSMQTFNRSNTRRHRRDFDASGADGEVGSFEVSDDSSESSSPDGDTDSEAMGRA